MKKRKVVHVENGIARDSEYILRIRGWIEDVVREDQNIQFAFTKLFWDFVPETNQFKFKLKFYN
jgi:hypothetical protein